MLAPWKKSNDKPRQRIKKQRHYFTYKGPNMLCLITQSCLPLCDPMDCNPPGSSILGGFPGKNTRVGCHALLRRFFPTQESNPGLPYCRQILYHLSHQGSLVMYGYESWIIKKAESTEKLMHSNCGAGEDSWESLGLQGGQTNQS